MEAPKGYQLTPKAHGVDMSTAGYAARLIRVGPKLTTQKVLAPTGSNRADIEAIELNGGFAASGSAVLPMLGLQDDDERVNTWGSAIAMRHHASRDDCK